MGLNHQQYLDEFEQRLSAIGTQYDVLEIAPDIYQITPKILKSQAVVTLVALTHGEEVIGIPLFNLLLKKMSAGEIVHQGSIYLVIANLEAYLKNQRYIDEDLNRVYGGGEDSSAYECQRAEIIKPIITQSDYIIDIHQCMHKTISPFAFAINDAETIAWLQAVIPSAPIIARDEVAKASTLASYGFLEGKKAVTLEVGEGGVDDVQLNFGMQAIIGFLDYVWKDPMQDTQSEQYDDVYRVSYFQPYSTGKVRFIGNLANFDEVTKDQVIAYIDDEPIAAPQDGLILFYPTHWFEVDSPTKADGLFILVQQI